MGFLDKLKSKASEVKEKAVEVVDERGPQIKGGIEKAGDFVDKKTKGKYSDKIAKGTKKAEEAIDKIDKDADTPTADQPPSPPAPGPGHAHEGHDHPHPHPPTPPASTPPTPPAPPTP
jgi:hypothetical protein